MDCAAAVADPRFALFFGPLAEERTKDWADSRLGSRFAEERS
jgi:hypothetical protein